MLTKPTLITFLLLTLFFKAAITIDVHIPLKSDPKQSFAVKNIHFVKHGYGSINANEALKSFDTVRLQSLLYSAQYVAAKAVSDGYFADSNHEIRTIYDWKGRNTDSNSNNAIDHSEDIYYNLSLIDSHKNALRAQINIDMRVHYAKVDFEIKSLTVEYNEVVPESPQINPFSEYADDTNKQTTTKKEPILDSKSAVMPHEARVIVQGTSAINWLRIENIGQKANNNDIKYMLKLGADYVLKQNYDTSAYEKFDASYYTIEKIYSAFESANLEGWINYKFDVLVSSEVDEFRMNYQMKYNKEKSTIDLYSWSLEEHLSYPTNRGK